MPQQFSEQPLPCVSGKPLEHFAEFIDTTEDRRTPVTDSITVQPVLARHSECCFGLILYHHGTAVLGWTGDSGKDCQLYERICVAPDVFIDARQTATSDHAGFQEVNDHFAVLSIRGQQPRVHVYGYGCLKEAPPDYIFDFNVLRPGSVIPLRGR